MDTPVVGQVALNDAQVAIMKEQADLMARVVPSGMISYHTTFDVVTVFCAAACAKGVSYIGAIENNAPSEVLEGRKRLIDEEVNLELMPLLNKIIDNGGSSLEQKAELLDHICDSIYVLVGLATNVGLPLDNAFQIVHEANMSKVLGPLVPTGPTFNEYGKVMKPEGWIAPDKKIWDLCFWLYSQRVKQPTNGPEETAGQEPTPIVFDPVPIVPESLG